MFLTSRLGGASERESVMATVNGISPSVSTTRGAAAPEDYRRHVRRTFRRAMRGYSPAEVDAHLEKVQGWFSLAGFGRLLEERRDELLGDAQREAEAILERARRESETILAEARRRDEEVAAAERRLAAIKALASEILEEDLRGPG